MRLVFLSHDGKCCGGAQKCLADLLKGIRLRFPDIQLFVIFPCKDDLLKACLPYIDGYKVIDMAWWLLAEDEKTDFKRKFRFIRKARKPIREIIRYLREIRPDYGITNTIVTPYLAVACKLIGIKHSWFVHEIPNTWNDERFIYSHATILKCVKYLSCKVFVTSEYAKTYYHPYIPTQKLIVVNQAVELDIPASTDTFPHQRYTLLLVGTFNSNKGQLELLEAVNMIVADRKDIYCYLVGDGTHYMDACKEYVTLHHLEQHVAIVPFAADVWKYYYRSDVLVVCSTLETFGRVTVEAQKCGLPVILSNVGANPERIVDHVNGLLYQKGNLPDLVSKIEWLREATTRQTFSQNIVLSNIDKYNVTEFAFHFITNLIL